VVRFGSPVVSTALAIAACPGPLRIFLYIKKRGFRLPIRNLLFLLCVISESLRSIRVALILDRVSSDRPSEQSSGPVLVRTLKIGWKRDRY